MFDWIPKKKIITTQAPKKNKDADFGELFSTEEINSKSNVIPERPVSEIPTDNINKTSENEQVTEKHELKVGEAAELSSGLRAIKQEVEEFSLDDEKISPSGAASSHQDTIRSNRAPSEKWEIPDVLKFLNNIDANEMFSSPISEIKPKDKAPKLSARAPEIPKNIKENKPKTDATLTSQKTDVPIDDEDAKEDELIKQLIKKRYPHHSGKEKFDKELKTSSSPYINAFFDTQDAPPTMIVDDFGDRSLWELQLNNSNLPGMELEEFSLISFDHIHINEMRRGFRRARRDFIKFISYHNQQDLYAAGLDDIDLALLRKGCACENFNVHRKVPYEYGGTNDFSNLCLIQTHPYHDNLHKFLDMQIFIHPKGAKVKRLFIPIPNGNVYVPYLDITGSGGKSKHDRSVYAGFHEETFNLIAQKTAMGKAAEL